MMSSYICPSCKTENSLNIDFAIEQYICRSCSMLINADHNSIEKSIKKPTENVVLEVGQKGKIDGIVYEVVAIVVKKYGSSVYWREYYLKDKNLNDAFLSEGDGHWVFLQPQKMPEKEFKFHAEFNGKKYRWYESTPNNIHAAAGFFEKKLKFTLATYKEFVNGTEMVSLEQVGSEKTFFWGKHVSRSEIKRNFDPSYMPNYSGIGIVQPYYINIKQLINIFATVAIIISLIQLYNTVSRSNYEVFNDKIRFDSIINKEKISRSFVLQGASAPLNVKLYSNVDNSWANVELSLINEKTNEIEYTSQDIEEYHGYTDGESWSEGDKHKEFNFCGVAPGKYHFAVNAQKQGFETPSNDLFFTPDGTKSFKYTGDGFVDQTILSSGEKVAYNLTNLQTNDSAIYAELQKAKEFKLKNPDFAGTLPSNDENPNFEIRAFWKPVSFWNYFIICGIMLTLVLLNYWGKYLFDKEKWKNSNYSPYTQYTN